MKIRTGLVIGVLALSLTGCNDSDCERSKKAVSAAQILVETYCTVEDHPKCAPALKLLDRAADLVCALCPGACVTRGEAEDGELEQLEVDIDALRRAP